MQPQLFKLATFLLDSVYVFLGESLVITDAGYFSS